MTQQQDIFSVEEYNKNFKKNKKVKKEEKVQVLVCDYLKKRYPDVVFQCDLASGMNLGKWIGGMNARFRSSRGMPDLFIAKPSAYGSVTFGEVYHGLFIELKRDGVKIFKKDGDLVADEHIREQAAILERLRDNGYAAEFACGFEEAVKIIDQYLSG